MNMKDFRFYTLDVESIYWVGGFGDTHYIGWVRKEYYVAPPALKMGKMLGEIEEEAIGGKFETKRTGRGLEIAFML